MRLRPVPAAPQLPAVNDVAYQVQGFAVRVAQKIQQGLSLATRRAKMDIRYPDRADKQFWQSVFRVHGRHLQNLTQMLGSPHDATMKNGFRNTPGLPSGQSETRERSRNGYQQNQAFLFFSGACLLAALLFVAYVALALNWSYSNGERAGFLQKLSSKGWVCKTWEGELSLVAIPGASPEKFLFTVRNTEVVGQLNALMGKRVALDYEQHKGLPSSCWGETEYFVTGVREAGF